MPQYLSDLADLYDKPLTQYELLEANISDTSKTVTLRVSQFERSLIALVAEYTDDFANMCAGINGSTPPVAVLKKISVIQNWLNTVWDQSPMLKQIISALPLNAESAARFARLAPQQFLPGDTLDALEKPNIEKLVIIDDRAGTRSSVTIPKHEMQGAFS